MSLQEAVLHGQLSAREIEGVLRDLHRDITLSPADEKQIKGTVQFIHSCAAAARPHRGALIGSLADCSQMRPGRCGRPAPLR
jgi:hypothetical protein